ncbi:hypothetical protein HK096_005045, partial [Nowakowskiella sp. JEL0078]
MIKPSIFSEISETSKSKLVKGDNQIKNGVETVCSVCMEEFKIKDHIRVLSCNHVFHKTCIDTWLTERSTLCPNCRLDTRIALGIKVELEDLPAVGEQQEGSDSNNEPLNTEAYHVVLVVPESEENVNTR